MTEKSTFKAYQSERIFEKKLALTTKKDEKTMMRHFKSKPKRFIISTLLFLILLAAGGNEYPRENADTGQLDSYIETAGKDWKIPGMAAAIVKDGQVVLAKGYGLREFSKPGKVDEKTLFAIASNTKAFTAATLAILTEEKKIQWDHRVREYLPYFTLYDPYVTEEMRVRDLLCHRCGLDTFSGDLLWYETPYSTEEVIKRARFLKPSYGFRGGYGYSNIMFMAAGEIIPAVTGTPWKDFVKERIFKPLGMDTTHVGTGELKKYRNVASPHYVYSDGKTVTIPYTTSDRIGAAGGINSNISDMSRWLIMLLNHGTFENKRILSETSIKEMWTPHTNIPAPGSSPNLFPSTHFRCYGLGWVLLDYHGHKIIYHSGALDGMISRVALVPEIKLGLVVLTNSINDLPRALMYRIIDTYLDVTPRDWSRIYLDLYRESIEKEKQQLAEITKNKTPCPVKLEDYTGRYGGPMYGDARVSLENKNLVLRFLPAPVLISDLSHLHYDTFQLKLRNTLSFIPHGMGTVQFMRDKHGNVVEMKVDIPNQDFWFHELEFKKKE